MVNKNGYIFGYNIANEIFKNLKGQTMFKKFKLALAVSALTVFFVGCGDEAWVEFKPENEMDKRALEAFKKHLPDKVAYRYTYDKMNKGKIVDETKTKKTSSIHYQFKYKDEARKDDYSAFPYFFVACDVEKDKCSDEMIVN